MHIILATLQEQGRSQVWLAKQLGVSPWLVNRWIKGHKTPPSDTLARCAVLLGIPQGLVIPRADDVAA